MVDNKTCSVDILGVSLGEEGYLIIPRQTRELCEPLVKAADALEKALDDLPVDVADKNRIAGLSAELMAQTEQYAVVLGIQAYRDFNRTSMCLFITHIVISPIIRRTAQPPCQTMRRLVCACPEKTSVQTPCSMILQERE